MIEFARTKLEFDDLAYEALLNKRVRIQPAPDLEVYFSVEVSFRSTVSPTIKVRRSRSKNQREPALPNQALHAAGNAQYLPSLPAHNGRKKMPLCRRMSLPDSLHPHRHESPA